LHVVCHLTEIIAQLFERSRIETRRKKMIAGLEDPFVPNF
jgi:hypothetical protein